MKRSVDQDMRRLHAPLSALMAAASVGAACGGKAVLDPDLAMWEGGGGTFVPVGSSGVAGAGAAPGGAPPIPPLVETDMGDVVIGTGVSYDLAPGALGFTAIASTGDDSIIGMERMAAPDTANVVQAFGIGGTLMDYRRPGWSTAGVPNTDHPQAMPPMQGQWAFTLGGDVSVAATAHLSVWHRQTLDGEFHGGLIDVNFFIAPGTSSPTYLEQLAHSAFDGWAGLMLGTVRFYDLPAAYAIITDANAAAAIAATDEAVGKPVLNVLVVDFIDTESTPLGFSPGIPGNALGVGTYQSAIVMIVNGATSFDRLILRHESGHFSGLFHTTEQAIGYGDVLDDTPFCEDVLGLGPTCPDYDNLMFPFADVGNKLLMSAKQATVVQASALYRAAVEEGGGFAEPLDGSGMEARSGMAIAAARAPAHASVSDDGARGVTAPRAHGPHVSLAAVRLLGSLLCDVGQEIDVLAILKSAGVTSGDVLVEIGLDAHNPRHVRARALRFAGVWPLASWALSSLEELARAVGVDRALRLSALRGLERAAPERGRAVRAALVGDSDVALRNAVLYGGGSRAR